MPSELRFVLFLVALTAAAGAASVFGIYRQDAAQKRTQAEAMTGGHVAAGKVAIGRYNCGACHSIPGVPGANGVTGPALDGMAVRAQIAGVMANRPDNLIYWLRYPQRVLPRNGMPDQGVSEKDARDMAAFLYTTGG